MVEVGGPSQKSIIATFCLCISNSSAVGAEGGVVGVVGGLSRELGIAICRSHVAVIEGDSGVGMVMLAVERSIGSVGGSAVVRCDVVVGADGIFAGCLVIVVAVCVVVSAAAVAVGVGVALFTVSALPGCMMVLGVVVGRWSLALSSSLMLYPLKASMLFSLSLNSAAAASFQFGTALSAAFAFSFSSTVVGMFAVLPFFCERVMLQCR